MDIFLTHPNTGEFIGVAKASPSPLEPGEFLFPSNFMRLAVPPIGVNQTAVGDGVKWTVVDDYRGTVYYLPDGSRHEISDLGIVPPLNSTPTPPPETNSAIIARKKPAIETERARRWRGGFSMLIDGVTKWFHSDEFSLVQYIGLKDAARDVLAAGGTMNDSLLIAGQPVSWSTMDGSFVMMTVKVAFDLVAACRAQQSAIFAASVQHKMALENSTDPASYDTALNWPPVFGE